MSQGGGATNPNRSAACLLQRMGENPPREDEARRAALAPTLGRGKEGGAREKEEQEEKYIQVCNYR